MAANDNSTFGRNDDVRNDDVGKADVRNDDVRGDWKASWETEDNYWTENFSSRPYAIGPDFYERFRPAYRYGFESAQHHSGRTWDDAEQHLKEGWDRYDHVGEHRSTWDEIKDAVRDAWDRVTGTGQGHAQGDGATTDMSDRVDDHATMRTRRDEPLT